MVRRFNADSQAGMDVPVTHSRLTVCSRDWAKPLGGMYGRKKSTDLIELEPIVGLVLYQLRGCYFLLKVEEDVRVVRGSKRLLDFYREALMKVCPNKNDLSYCHESKPVF